MKANPERMKSGVFVVLLSGKQTSKIPKCSEAAVPSFHGCSPVNLLHIFRTPFPKNTFGWLLLNVPDKSVGLRISLYEQIFPKENDKEMKFAKFQK